VFLRFTGRLARSTAAASRAPLRRGSQRGFAYLMALFMVVTLIIASQVAMRNLVTEGRREREAEMIWRGQQYVRAIRLYYRKTGHYPQTLDDLKKGMPELHFLRYAAYKDPMKKDDGAWRFIYVNSAGQIIGSVKYATLQQMAVMDMNGGKIPGAQNGDQSNQPGVPASALADQSAAAANAAASPQNPAANSNTAQNAAPGALPDASANSGTNPQNPATAQQNSTPAQTAGPAQPTQNPTGTPPAPTNAIGAPAAPGVNLNQNLSMAALAALKPTGPVDGPVLGGFLSGVASSVDKPSVRVYNGGKKYLDWEFIWNPVEDQAKAVQQGISNPGGALPGQPGQPIGNGAAGTSIFGNTAGGLNASPNGPGAANPMSPNPMAPQNSNPFQPAPAPQQ